MKLEKKYSVKKLRGVTNSLLIFCYPSVKDVILDMNPIWKDIYSLFFNQVSELFKWNMSYSFLD